MESLRISKGGQVSLPSAIRRRWGVTALMVEDLGDAVVLRPMPTDPVGAARGALGPARIPLDAARAEERAAEVERERASDRRRRS